MRNTVFIGIIAVLVLLQVVPRICQTLEERKEAEERKKHEYQREQLYDAVKEGQNAVMDMQRYRELREKEKRGYSLSLDERSELGTLTDNLGYWFERQGEKLTKRYGIQRFSADEIDALVGVR